MTKEEIINETITFVKDTLKNAEGGHDWWHIYRVWQMAKKIAQKKNVNLFIVEIGALLHDIADAKFNNGNEDIAPKMAENFLEKQKVETKTIQHILEIIKNISFKGGNEEQKFQSSELAVIQDADRLDAIGAIGIARTFNYGGFKNRELYNPNIPPKMNMTKEEYRKNEDPTINHFYEKLLLLKNRMNTETAKKIAEERHNFMENFLFQFYKEWEGEL